MARIIKRYENRKLYDSSAKQYITLEVVASFVRAGEEIQIIENKTGKDITNVVLSKVVSEIITDSAEKTKVPSSVFTEVIQRRSDAVVDYLKTGIAAGVRTVKDVEEQIQQGWRKVAATEQRVVTSATEDLKSVIQRMIDESLQFLINKMNLPTRTEMQQLNSRLADIETQLAAQNGHQKKGKKGKNL